MPLIATVSIAAGTVKTTFAESFAAKGLAAIITAVFGVVLNLYAAQLFLMLVMYSFDLITGIWYSIQTRQFESNKFRHGLIKLLVYGILICIAISIDSVVSENSVWFLHLDTHVFLEMTFVFLIMSDAFSTLENLENLGFDTPIRFWREQVGDKMKMFFKTRKTSEKD